MRRKTSVYIDESLWNEFKKKAVSMGKEVSKYLEEVIEEELLKNLEKELNQQVEGENYELDFEPIEVGEIMSDLVREMRDERGDSLSGQWCSYERVYI